MRHPAACLADMKASYAANVLQCRPEKKTRRGRVAVNAAARRRQNNNDRRQTRVARELVVVPTQVMAAAECRA